MTRSRPIRLEFYVNEKELNLIHDRMKRLSITDRSAYLRKAAIDVNLLYVDTEKLEKELNELSFQISKIGNNINQIAKHFNEEKKTNSNELERLMDCIEHLNKLYKGKLHEVKDVLELDVN
ncbi:plasmid mobilization relaxosome protein MobC [Clostridium sp.]|uniref:plasmid mobilization protein n=1 Tax=Clostridium sp. TaxID=1506 RepID=UPI0029026BB9|nr:plasmid mobilization relaxosome protein MobC [Clostridium sp.]MDU2156332.1 plasmid mobilization relaxosome protein MobC [Clostridium sp.]